ncbi:E3 ubiquitin-protein ligase XIAP-like isoform X2 [Mytilus californianus]|uniref:E3 ubiquitin-protein ligase XIAP-like isoform X2 n=1 Tax=Mytilus californianus TaxID=6549 RepID=UPI002246D7C8|nr:E3 ubiquitin-protein ligase XIAP-like isoform X2 [Mytilus californianus]
MCKSYTISNPLQRYSTFVNWPFDESEKKTLADAGFVYTGKEDILKCETCDKTTRYHHWKGKKTPSQAHIDLNRHCEFAKDTSKVTSLYNRLHGRPMYPYYKEYHQRLSSYSSWKFEAIQSSKGLADAGFFSTGEQDETICFSCGLWLTDWQNDEKPWIVHVRYFSKCPYIKEQKTLCFIRNVLEDWQKIYRPMHLNFEDETKRASSFNLFNGRNVCLSPDSLAEAGFFQDGNRFVVCHYCNIRLLTWTTDVNPWEMHARWSGRAQSECQYLVIRKGKHFVDSVLKKYVDEQEKIKNKYDKGGKSRCTSDICDSLKDNVPLRNESEVCTYNDILKGNCITCKNEKATTLFLKCGHRITCHKCSLSFTKCPYCETNVKSRIITQL